MDSNDATILALALGIPSATLLSIAFLLVLRIEYRQLQAQRIRNPTVPTNSPAPSPPPVDPYYGVPFKQRPPRINAPLPHRPIPLHEFNKAARSEEESLQSVPPGELAPRPPTPPRRRTPVIIISPTTSADDHPHTPRSPSPGEYTHYRENSRGFNMGRDIRVTTPLTRDHTWDANPPAPSAPVSPSEFWDNITIPLSAYLPAPCDGSPEHRTPPPVSAYTQHRGAPDVWDRPVTTWQPALEPVQDDEPVASGSTLPVPNDSSYWSNVIEQHEPTRRPRLHCRRWGRIDRQLTAEPQPPPELLAPPESRYYEYFTSETSGEGTLQELPRPPMPFPDTTPHPDGRSNSDSTSEPTLHPQTSTRDGSA